MSSTFADIPEANTGPIAGGAPEPGELLCSDTKYMDSGSAQTAQRWIDSWRNMSREEFEESASRL